MSLLELLSIKLIILLRLDKIINSFRKYVESKEKRGDIEKERNLRDLANFSRNVGHEYFADYFEKQAEIIKNTKNNN